MASNTNSARPRWMTDEVVEGLKRDLSECQNPYTEAEAANVELDGTVDLKRYNAYTAKYLLTKYGII